MASLPLFDRLDEPALCSVSELTAQIKDVLETDFADVALVGEVSNLARPRSGHVYLSLKDDSAQIRAVIWKSVAQRLAFDLSDGLSVRVFGELAVYAPRGEYQITIRRVEPEGIGALELAFRQRFEKLKAEGLFDPDRKRPLPRVSQADRGREQPHRRGDPRLPPGDGPTVVGDGDPDRPGPRARRGGGGGSRRRDRAGQPGEWGRPDRPGPRGREPGRPLGVQRGGRRAGDRRIEAAGGLGDRPRG